MYLAEVKACADHKELFSAVSVTAIYTGFTSYYLPDGVDTIQLLLLDNSRTDFFLIYKEIILMLSCWIKLLIYNKKYILM